MDPVIVVGAGPTGLSLALALARLDVPVTLLERTPEPPAADDARTAVLHHDTLAFLSRIGYRRVLADGTAVLTYRLLRRRQELAREHLPSGDAGLPVPTGPQHPGAADQPPPPRDRRGRGRERSDPADRTPPPGTFPAALHISRNRLVRGLLDALGPVHGAGLTTGVTVDAIEQDRDQVRVHTTGPGGGTWWTGSHVVGCDGARSAVRKLLGIRFPGRTAVDRRLSAIVAAPLPFPDEARIHRDPPRVSLPGGRGARAAEPSRELTALPLPDGRWRIDWTLPARRPGAPSGARVPAPAGAHAPEELVARMRAALALWCDGQVPPYEPLQHAEYTAHQRLARRFRRGRGFLAGDAAHLLGAIGMQSLEEGLRDAANLSWKLALVRDGSAGPGLLDSYEAERRGAVGNRLRGADQVLPLLRPSGSWNATRRAVLSGSTSRHLPLLGSGILGTGRLGAAPVYGDSPLAVPTARSLRRGAPPRPGSTDTPDGAPVEDVPVIGADGRRGRLSERLGRGFILLLVAPGTGVWASEHWLGAGLMPKLGEALRALPVPGELLVADAYPGAAAHTVLLIRPDGHLVQSMAGCRPAELLAYADTARGGPAELRDAGDGAASGSGSGPADVRDGDGEGAVLG
ncbi:hypothetical protein BIV57_16210 [Mangrovactinospora gilvigrisea]|uniref:FAD-binding domain-containing protein n=1 Tax=Mangrovactinospora gilvigrisea TaxID=1428644 RepID=A0A1J7BSM9_9ACTN|nr:FAD-dependent oxidoreductase [Mangrovactinospora gilvigrisea]OIV36465.1 hypothetical protein BIV57_16210 [Mangrovactinospora gilvigrisea]